MEEAIKAANKAKEAMNKNVIEAEQVTIENPYAVIDNKLNTNDTRVSYSQVHCIADKH